MSIQGMHVRTYSFQPVCLLDGSRQFGHEAIHFPESRPAADGGSDRFSGRSLDETAELYFGSPLVGRDMLLFLSLPADMMTSAGISRLAARLAGLPAGMRSRMVFNIQDSFETDENRDGTIEDGVELLRSCQCGVSFSGFGMGAAAMNRMMRHDPDFVKLDRAFVHGLADSASKQRDVRALLVHFAYETPLVLEGLDRKEDLDMAVALGAAIGQGLGLMPNIQLRDEMMLWGNRL